MTTPTDQLLQRVPPQAIDAEQAALGAMLLETEAIDKAMDLLRPEDFYRESHRYLYRAIATMRHNRKPVDLITLADWLKTRAASGQADEENNLLALVGGTLYLTTIMQAAPTAAGIAHYAGIVRRKALQRRLIEEADAIMHAAYTCEDDVETLIQQSEERVIAVGQRTRPDTRTRPLADIVRGEFNRIEDEIAQGQSRGFKSGWKGLNSIISPLGPGQMTVVGARPGMGKTAWALNLAVALCAQGVAGLIFSLEMTAEELGLRALVGQTTRHGQNELDDMPYCQMYQADVLAELAGAVEQLWQLPLSINDQPGMTVREMDRELRRYRREHGELPGFIVVDFVQMVGGAEEMKRANAFEKLAGNMRDLANLATQHKLHVVALSQIRRDVETRPIKRPLLSDFAEAAWIETVAYRALTLYRPGYYGPEECRRVGLDPERHRDFVELYRVKQRGGGLPVHNGRVQETTFLRFDGAHARMIDLTPEDWRGMHVDAGGSAPEQESAYQALGGGQ